MYGIHSEIPPYMLILIRSRVPATYHTFVIFLSVKRFSVGRVFEMTMEIKPRSINGVITSVHGRRDFVLLQLRNGSLELSVDNGKGIITATYEPSSPWSFCDGKWHSVQCKSLLLNLHTVYIWRNPISSLLESPHEMPHLIHGN